MVGDGRVGTGWCMEPKFQEMREYGEVEYGEGRDYTFVDFHRNRGFSFSLLLTHAAIKRAISTTENEVPDSAPKQFPFLLPMYLLLSVPPPCHYFGSALKKG